MGVSPWQVLQQCHPVATMASLCKQQDLRLYLGSHSLAYKRSNAPPGGQQATVDSWCFEVPIALVPTQPVRRNYRIGFGAQGDICGAIERAREFCTR